MVTASQHQCEEHQCPAAVSRHSQMRMDGEGGVSCSWQRPNAAKDQLALAMIKPAMLPNFPVCVNVCLILRL